jgi:hypothetical protein
MVFKLFGEIATSSKTTPYSMPYFAIITFNSYSKQLTNTLLAVFKTPPRFYLVYIEIVVKD